MNIGFDKIGLSSYLSSRIIIDSKNDGNVIRVVVDINNHTIYDTSIFGVNGKADFYDLDCLVSEFLRNNSICLAKVKLSCFFLNSMESIESWVVYSDFRTSYEIPADFLRNHFLSSRSYYNIPRGQGVNLYFIIHKDDNEIPNGTIFFSFKFDNGKVHTDSFDVRLTDKEQTAIYSYFVNEAAFILHLQKKFKGRNVKVLSGSVVFGSRHMDFYFIDDIPVEKFSFLNAFNIWETYYVMGAQTIKSEFERNFGMLSGRPVLYAQSTERKVQIETVPLTLEEAEWLNQFLGSPRVIKTIPPDDDQTVLISDIDSVISDSPKELVQLKFSWSFSEPYVWKFCEYNLQPFSNHYNETFK